MGAQLQSLTCTTAQDILENLFPIWLLVHINFFVPSHFWTTHVNFDNCCQHYNSNMQKEIYIGASTFSDLKYCSGTLWKSFCYLYRTQLCTSTFSQIFFYNFRNFRPQFCINCGATCQWKCKLSGLSERVIPSQKTLKTRIKLTHKLRHNTCSKYVAVERTARWPQSVREKNKHSNIIFSHLQPAPVVWW